MTLIIVRILASVIMMLRIIQRTRLVFQILMTMAYATSSKSLDAKTTQPAIIMRMQQIMTLAFACMRMTLVKLVQITPRMVLVLSYSRTLMAMECVTD